MSLAAMGGANLQELDQIGRRLEGKVGDGEAWHEAWEWMADKVLSVAAREWHAGHLHTAAGAFVRSAVYRYTSEAFVPPDDPRKGQSSTRLLEHFEKGMAFRKNRKSVVEGKR